MTNLAAADGAIACWDDKYYWNFWRPMAAIREADTDGNRRRSPTPAGCRCSTRRRRPRRPLRIRRSPTIRPVTAASAARCSTRRDFFGTDKIAFDMHSGRFPGDQPRHFERFSQALKEIVDARVWGGIHFRTADVQGAVIGKKVAHWLRKHYFQPVR